MAVRGKRVQNGAQQSNDADGPDGVHRVPDLRGRIHDVRFEGEFAAGVE